MATMRCECERCGQARECTYHGSAGDVDADKVQNGEWLCDECVPLRAAELDAAIQMMKDVLGGGGQ